MDVETTEAVVDVDVITTDADATTAAIMDGDSAEIIPAAISCGSSFCCACAEITAVDVTTAAAMATAAGSSSFCFCCATMAADVDADNFSFRQRAVPSAFFGMIFGRFIFPLFRLHTLSGHIGYILSHMILPVLLFFSVSDTFKIYFIKSISIYDQLFFIFV